LAINQVSGEVFIATEKGILGFKSTATSPANEFVDLVVYPNPVRPELSWKYCCKGNDE
jgi:hypothetical protein